MKVLLLTFDLEEFDWPVERGHTLDPATQLAVTSDGLARLMPILTARRVRATFFATASFAAARPEVIRNLVAEGHEIAAHGLSHRDDYGIMDEGQARARLSEARRLLESIAQRSVIGFRAPRLRAGTLGAVRDAGYRYDATVHPTWVPGRYQTLRAPRRPWREEGVIRIPISVVPGCRWPLSFVWFRAAGVRLTTLGAQLALADTGYLQLYFHPWEAMPIARYGIPRCLAVHTGLRFAHMLARLLAWADRLESMTIAEYVDRIEPTLA